MRMPGVVSSALDKCLYAEMRSGFPRAIAPPPTHPPATTPSRRWGEVTGYFVIVLAQFKYSIVYIPPIV